MRGCWLAGWLVGWLILSVSGSVLFVGDILWRVRALHMYHMLGQHAAGDVNRAATQQAKEACPPPLARLASVWHALWRCDRQSQSKHKHFDWTLSTVRCCDLVHHDNAVPTAATLAPLYLARPTYAGRV